MNIWICMFVMAGVSFLLRALPLTLIRGQIKNRFVRSALYYLPYATLSVMTVPAIFTVAENIWCGVAALIAAAVTAWKTSNLLLAACVACAAVALVNML